MKALSKNKREGERVRAELGEEEEEKASNTKPSMKAITKQGLWRTTTSGLVVENEWTGNKAAGFCMSIS